MSTPKGRWAHIPIVDLFDAAGIPLESRKGGAEYTGGHPHSHDSKSGSCMVVWPESARWYCSSCLAKGDAADFLVDVGQADTRDSAEQILTAKFGPPQISTGPHLTDLGNAQRMARRGYMVELLETHGLYNEFKELYWDNKRNQRRQEEVQALR